MPGLSFLSKKSWHTSNIKNVEQVWLAEQKHEQEQKKLAELQKQLEEERQIQELRQLQVASGQVVKTVDTTLDWMYEGPASAARQQETSEEYLLGKIFKQKGDTSAITNSISGNTASNKEWLGKAASKSSSFTRLHEDPIFAIKQEELKKRESILKNELKMDKIRQKLSMELREKESERKAKKEKKKMKKEKKKDKKSKGEKRRHDGGESGSSLEEEEEDRKRRRRSSDSEPRRDRSRSGSRERSGMGRQGRHRKDDQQQQQQRDGGQRYGLISGDGRERQPEARSYLGPNMELIQKKQEKEREEREQRMAQLNRSKQTLSEEEKQRRLAEMQHDADAYERRRNTSSSLGEKERDQSHVGNGEFLRTMRSDVYKTSCESGIQDRLSQNRHYIQKSADLDGNSYKSH